jgi:hypothetical protein
MTTFFRITKYNPIYRDARGYYTKDEWLGFFQVGKKWDENRERILTMDEYQKTENDYIKTALEIKKEANVPTVKLRGVEFKPWTVRARKNLCADRNGKILRELVRTKTVEGNRDFCLIVKAILRDTLWAKLENRTKTFYLHFGWDYYMYLGTTIDSERVFDIAKRNNLFAEFCDSPLL